MAFNLNKEGKSIAVIDGGKFNKKVLSIETNADHNKNITKEFSKLSIELTAKFQQIPDNTLTRSVGYIVGASGSGKSTYVCNYLKQYKKVFKENQIYCFSALDEDESIDGLDIKRILIDESLIEDPIEIEDFKDSIIIFDDIDVLNPKLKKPVWEILNKALQIGRHHNISVLVTMHLPTNKHETKIILTESQWVVYFPHSGGGRGTKYLLTEYLGLDTKSIQRIKRLKTRWCCIFKNYPQFCLTEHDAFLLGDD